MPKRRVNRRRQTKNQSFGFVALLFPIVMIVIVMLLIIKLIEVVDAVVGYLNSPAGQSFIAVCMKTFIVAFTIGISLFYTWRYYRKRSQKRHMIAKQQERMLLEQERMLLLEIEQIGREHAEQEPERMLSERQQRERERVEREKEE